MQDHGFGLPRIYLPRTRVDRSLWVCLVASLPYFLLLAQRTGEPHLAGAFTGPFHLDIT